MKTPTPKPCPNCSTMFIATHGNQVYCSKECKKTYRKILATKPQTGCAYCGGPFKEPYQKKYCSKNCRLYALGRKKPPKSLPIMNYAQNQALADSNQKARDTGLSYGKYIGKLYAAQFCNFSEQRRKNSENTKKKPTQV